MQRGNHAQQDRFRNTPTRFWMRVDQSAGPGGCWPWTLSRLPKGYGRVAWSGRNENAHRVAFFLTRGYWPNICRHSCDNPPCCNPAHLEDGTSADNARDRDQRRYGR